MLFFVVDVPAARQRLYYTAELKDPTKTYSCMNDDTAVSLPRDEFQAMVRERVASGYRLQHIYGSATPLV